MHGVRSLLGTLASLVPLTMLACSSAPPDEHTQSASNDLRIPKCPEGQSVECTSEGPRGQVLCVCVVDATHSVGGTVTGLTGPGLVLQGGDVGWNPGYAYVNQNGTYAMTLTGSAYDVVLFGLPANEACTVSNASGDTSADVTNVNVACGSPSYVQINSSSSTSFVPPYSTYRFAGGAGGTASGDGTFTTPQTNVFTIPWALPPGSPFTVTPGSSPGHTCSVTGSPGFTGPAGSTVTVEVSCS